MTKFYCTTAIDYPNGRPHIGHAYEKIITDSYNRWYKLLGYQTHYLTGTDENGQKLIESAKAAGKDTQNYVDENVVFFKELCEKADVKYDDFIRTTEKRHHDVCHELWKKIEDKGLIHHGHYSGKYCLSCESFYTESQAPDGNCPEHHKPLDIKEEEGFFFKLSSFQSWIIDYLKANPTFITPKTKYNEILSRLEGDDLMDLSISRPNQGWGVEVPGNNKFVMYTWFDALINYYSALNESQREFWPADMHVIGKDILWFHSVIWPCILKACDLPLPKQVYVHGMVLAEDGKKMSKSLGNVVDPMDMLAKYPCDTFRYYLIRNISASSDGKFSEAELVSKHNTELGNDYGNLLMRVIKLSMKTLGDVNIDATDVTQEIDCSETFKKAKSFMDEREHNKAIETIWEFIYSLNQYVNDKEPWKHKEDLKQFKHIVYNCLYGMQAVTFMLQAFMPTTAASALTFIGSSLNTIDSLEFGKASFKLTEPVALFPKIEA
ncbi:methionine--tRNA ligase [Bacteriovorax sp. Seq25_V]|uniref:methionine--tRNA ligase n=1 Tax=Bacteriovorax sp. Seq25_V TaxID=1201288 RepID=UPI000389E7F3|nr:methionine--tRNA ligase [Bacteriovorax sp. Seq25_V]EQC45424.1 methionine--tRNA ligase [Bacteriovorax sp. Seq25_V]